MKYAIIISALLKFQMLYGANTLSSKNKNIIQNPYRASLLYVALHPSSLKFEEASFTLYPNRSSLSSVGEQNRIKYSYALQTNNRAPILVVVPGFGGHAFVGGAQYIAEKFYNIGYSVVIIPSSTHWSFTLAASQTGRPGYLPEDAKDQYQVINTIFANLKNNHKSNPQSVSILGYSYGAIEAAAITKLDFTRKQFQFKNAILINPPLDLTNAMKEIDTFIDYGSKWSEKYKFDLSSYAIGNIFNLSQLPINEILDKKMIENLKLGDKQIAWLIANEFRRNLSEVVYIGQEISDDHILPAKGAEKNHAERSLAAKKYTFENYLDKIVYPSLSHKLKVGKAQLLSESNLRLLLFNKEELINKTLNLVVLHSSDDFLSFPATSEGKDALKQLGPYLNLFSHGGHMGSLAYDEFFTVLLKSLK